jgi:hypothetical protein
MFSFIHLHWACQRNWQERGNSRLTKFSEQNETFANIVATSQDISMITPPAQTNSDHRVHRTHESVLKQRLLRLLNHAVSSPVCLPRSDFPLQYPVLLLLTGSPLLEAVNKPEYPKHSQSRKDHPFLGCEELIFVSIDRNHVAQFSKRVSNGSFCDLQAPWYHISVL